MAGSFNAHGVANTLWAVCVLSIFCAPEEESRLVHAAVQRRVFLGKAACLNACFNPAQLCQLHQFFLWCSVETRLGVEAIRDLQSLKEICHLAFEGAQSAPSATQQQVSETLRHMGLSVEDEVRLAKSGYSIDMLVQDSTLGKEARAAAARARGQSSWMVLSTSLRAGRQRVPPCCSDGICSCWATSRLHRAKKSDGCKDHLVRIPRDN